MADKQQLETLDEFRSRTGSFNQNSLPVGKDMETNASLTRKVSCEGRMLGFGGNTIVFCLLSEVKEKIHVIQRRLYEVCGDILADPLATDTFHITLHDLVNGSLSAKLEQEILCIQRSAMKLANDISAEGRHIRMQSTFLFNMVNTSMVLGFEPVDEESCRILMEYYERFQNVVRLDYPLTPHVTLAYFKPGRIHMEQVGRLQSVIDFAKTQEKIHTELLGEMLEYQIFSDMNHYWKG